MRESNGVSEIQGLYGPIWIEEEGIQKLWALQYFQKGNWKTECGKPIRLIERGRWNHRRGPDFKEAIIEFNGCHQVGDIEIHLYHEDWWGHGHELDPEYNRVILHVVVFPSRALSRPARREDGKVPPVFLLAPWLEEDLENLSRQMNFESIPEDEISGYLKALSASEIETQIKELAKKRYESKLERARLLLKQSSAAEAMLLGFLLVLGYPDHRGLFYELGNRRSEEKGVDGLREIWERDFVPRIRYMGRPANHPNRRFKQFEKLLSEKTCFEDLVIFAENELEVNVCVQTVGSPTSEVRKQLGIHRQNNKVKEILEVGEFSTGFCQRLMTDLLLPMGELLNKRAKKTPNWTYFPAWFHGLPGDCPASYLNYLELLQSSRDSVKLKTGFIQGLYGLRDRLRVECVRAQNPL